MDNREERGKKGVCGFTVGQQEKGNAVGYRQEKGMHSTFMHAVGKMVTRVGMMKEAYLLMWA